MEYPAYSLEKEDTRLMMELFGLVNKKVESLPQNRITFLKIKLFVFTIFYIVLYLTAVFVPAPDFVFYLLYGIMGITGVLMFANFIHEAAHGNIFENPAYNRWTFNIFYLMGVNAYIWQKRHLLSHHKYSNIMDWDTDVEQSGPVNIFPHQKVRKFQRYQKYYVFLLYPLFLINWIFVRDFRDFFSQNRVIRKLLKIPFREYVKMIVFKIGFLFIMIGLPVLVGRVSLGTVMLAFLFLTVCGSLLGMVILLTAHANTTCEFPLPDSSGSLNESWFMHQFLSTNDISFDNWLTRHVLGNFNFHICHHLFPGISSVYAPEVTEVIKDFAREHGLPYRSLKLSESLILHYRLIEESAVNIIDEMEMEPLIS